MTTYGLIDSGSDVTMIDPSLVDQLEIPGEPGQLFLSTVSQMLEYIFGATSSPCCANRALIQTADDNEDRYGAEVINTVRRNFYVDDVLKSVPSEEKAVLPADQLIKLLKEGNFHLTKFSSNSRKLLTMLPQDERADPAINLDLDRLPVTRALGLHWDADSDTFSLSFLTSRPPNVEFCLPLVLCMIILAF